MIMKVTLTTARTMTTTMRRRSALQPATEAPQGAVEVLGLRRRHDERVTAGSAGAGAGAAGAARPARRHRGLLLAHATSPSPSWEATISR